MGCFETAPSRLVILSASCGRANLEADPSMVNQEQLAGRGEKELHEATRPFARESRLRSWWYVVTTFVLLSAALGGAALLPWWPVRLALSVVGGLILVRAFVLYHDFMHRAILRDSRVGRWLFYGFGLLALTPPRSWRFSHNHHHAHVAKPIPQQAGQFSLAISGVGAIPLMTLEMWRQAPTPQRLGYRIARHPATILAAYVTVFLLSICLVPTLRNPRKYWDGAISLAAHIALIAVVWSMAGFWALFFGLLLPATIASSLGAYLFFAQHNYDGLRVLPIDTWSHYRASLESSSFMKLGPLMNWFTANIGYHHVHHLNALIPFYRLPEAMQAIPELQYPTVTTLRPRDVLSCFRLSLWDSQRQQLVGFAQLRTGKETA